MEYENVIQEKINNPKIIKNGKCSIENKINKYEENDNIMELDILPFTWMEGDSLAPACQSEYNLIDEIFNYIKIDSNDILYDLGCGDGRICIKASELYGCYSIGIEIEKNLIDLFNKKCLLINDENIRKRIQIKHQDLRDTNINDGNIIFTYLLPEAMAEISEKLIHLLQENKKINKKCVIICNTWGIPNLKPFIVYELGPYKQNTFYLYNINSL